MRVDNQSRARARDAALAGDWVILFGQFRVSKARRLVEHDGKAIQLGSRAFEILTCLLEHAGQVVSHQALLDAVWPNVIVEDVSLRFQMNNLRKALGSPDAKNSCIINVPGRGYCFTAPISRVDEGAQFRELAF